MNAKAESSEQGEALTAQAEEAPAQADAELVADAPALVEQLVETPADPPAPVLRIARLVAVQGLSATIAWRGQDRPRQASIASEVERDVLDLAAQHGDSVLVEVADGSLPVVVGVLQTRAPRELRLNAATVTIEADREILLRSGRAAIRLREDGDIEVVGSRISASSRGLFRLVGRILRLN